MAGDGSRRRRAGMGGHRTPAAPQPPRAIRLRPPTLPPSISSPLHPLFPSSIPKALKEGFVTDSSEGWGLRRKRS
jgi:hypothetical protein